MNEERHPRKNVEWCPPEKRTKGRPRNSWMQEVTTGMRQGEGGLVIWNGSTGRSGERK